MVLVDERATVRQIYALAAALCERAGEEFPETREAASELIERLRIESGHPAPRLEDVTRPPRSRRRGRSRDEPPDECLNSRVAASLARELWPRLGGDRAPREDVLERGLEPDRERARENRGFAEGRDLDARREREPGV